MQCDENLYYFNNQCLNECPIDHSRVLESNKFCLPMRNKGILKLFILVCLDTGCEQCENDGSTCRKCSNGNYLHNEKCVKTCPINYHADRVNFVCKIKKGKNYF